MSIHDAPPGGAAPTNDWPDITAEDFAAWFGADEFGATPDFERRLFRGETRVSRLWVLDNDLLTPDEKVTIVTCFPEVDLRAFQLFACWKAFRVLPAFESAFPNDNRLRGALDTIEANARGRATQDELHGAIALAWDARRDAQRGANEAVADAAFDVFLAANYGFHSDPPEAPACVRCLRAILDGSLDTSLPVAEWPDYGLGGGT